MSNQYKFPLELDLLERPRINELIHQGLEHSLLTIFAGPGYGKTQAIAKNLANHNGKVLWLSLTDLDNSCPEFWKNLISAMKKDFLPLFSRMQSIKFPQTLSELDAFLRVLGESVSNLKQSIWVIDNFEVIREPAIINFFKTLVEINLENFCLVLLSNSRFGIESISNFTDDDFLISGEDLRFTEEEIERLFFSQNISLTKNDLSEISKFTSGWPLALRLLFPEYKKKLSNDILKHLVFDDINQIFDVKFFANYPLGLQKLLVKLSFLDGFPKSLLYELYPEGAISEIDMLKGNCFIFYDKTKKLYLLHNMYQSFLKNKSYLVNEEEKNMMFKTAAKHFAELEYAIESLTCFKNCNDPIGILELISKFASTYMVLRLEHLNSFLEYIELLTEEQLREYPIAEYLRAHIYLSNLQLEKAENLLINLEKRLLDDNTDESLALLGECYTSHGAIHMMTNQEDFGDYYEKACYYLPNGTRFKTKDKLLVENNHNFSMQDNKPGARERMERAVHKGVPWMSKALGGGMYGMEHLFSAESAYLTYQFKETKQHAYRAIYKAQYKAQHDLVCNAHAILARVGYMNGNFSEMSKEIQNIIDYVNKYEMSGLKEIRDTALAWYYIKLNDLNKVPQWIITLDESDHPLLSYGRNQLLYANYLVRVGNFAKLVSVFENPKGLYFTNGIWPDRIALNIMLAIAYEALGNIDASMNALWQAYDMSYNNDLTTLFVEANKYMLKLIEIATKQAIYNFDPKWLNLIYKRSNSFSKRALIIKNAYNKENLDNTLNKAELTKREKEILLDLSRGLTREQISEIHFISVNTVKSIITDIYSKLGATNRADAIFIALSNNYLS